MKAVVFNRHGGPEVLECAEVPDPTIKANEVLVEVKACSLNHLDVWARGGLPGIEIPLPHILGNDIAGVVRGVGELVSWVRSGDEVMLQPGISCGHCLECLAGRDSLCREYDILGYRPAGSGVGSLGIQVAKLRGARVIATASSDEKLAKAKELGADEIVNYTNADWPKDVKRLTNRRGVDVVFEHTGASTWSGSIASLKSNGRLVTCGATSGFAAQTDIRQIFYRHLTILGSFMGSKSELLEAMKFVESGKIRPVVDQILPLVEARRAHELMEDRAQFGKLVLLP